jgi:hypothetical protein
MATQENTPRRRMPLHSTLSEKLVAGQIQISAGQAAWIIRRRGLQDILDRTP